MTEVRLEYHLADAQHLVGSITTRLEDPSDLTADYLLLMIRSTQLNFEEQGRPLPFAELAPSTIERRFTKGMKGKGAKAKGSLAVLGSIQILRDTGLLMQSLGASANGPFETDGGFGESDKFSAVIGSNRPGADALQTGYAPHNLPGREYILFQAQDVDDMQQMAQDWLTGSGPYPFS